MGVCQKKAGLESEVHSDYACCLCFLLYIRGTGQSRLTVRHQMAGDWLDILRHFALRC